MRNYIFLVEVRPISKLGWWAIDLHYNSGPEVKQLDQFQWKWLAVRQARKTCRNLARGQGTNRRLELQIKGKDGKIKSKDSYGADPRTVRG